MTTDLPIDSSMIERWTNQWMRQLGFNDDQLFKRNHKVEQFTRFVLDRIKAKKTADITKREKLLVETLREYEHRLSQTGFENDIDEEFETMKLKQKESFIEKKHQELDLKEEKSIKELDQLSQKEQKLCQILTANQLDWIPDETLMKRIERLRDYLQTLENLKNERLTTVKSHRTRINDLSSQLDFKRDDCPTISSLLEEKYDSCLTTDALLQIETLINDLELKIKEQENRIDSLVHNLEKLYNKLSRDDASPPKRSAAYILRKNTAETVKQLENEIAELQAKRMATSQIYCESMKKKIEELYELSQIGPSERQPVDFENITPDTLDQCDREYDRLDDLYRRRKPVLDAYEQWKILAQQFAEFQKKSTSAARFHERGYSAVKEQAERKRFAVAVPKAERTCLIALEQWEKDHLNEQFLVNDVPLRQMIDQSQNTTTNMTTATTKSTTSSAAASTGVPQRTLAKANTRRKSLRQIVKAAATTELHISKTHHEEEAEDDTFEFTHIENVKHFNGLPRVVTSTPKTGKTNQSRTVVDTGRNKTNDPIQKRRPSKRLIPTRR